MSSSPISPPSSSPASSSTTAPSPSSVPVVSVSATPTPALLAYESIRLQHAVSYNKTDVLAFLTTNRVMLLAQSTGATLFSIPTSIISGHNISAAKSPQVMMRILYVPPPSSVVPPTPQSDAGTAKQAILQFTSASALEDRALWKEAIAQIQTRNQQQNAAQPMEHTTTTQPLPAASNTTVKQEPSQSASPTAASSASARVPSSHGLQAPSSSASAAERSSSPSPTPSPSPPPSSSVPTTTISLATLEVRAALLARHPHLKQLHSDLVAKGIISEEEFWSSPSHAELVRRESDASSHQQRGLSSAMAAEIAPSVTSTSVHFKVDANVMHAIFLHSPAVHRAYGQLVPTQMSEVAFWTRYFKSRYVHAGKNALLTGADRGKPAAADSAAESGDSFTRTIDDAEKKVEEEEAKTYGGNERRVKAVIQRKHVDPSVDLTSADADEAVMSGQPSILNHDHSNSDPGRGKVSKKSRAQAELVKKFNRHGMLVLDASAPVRKDDGASGVTGHTVKEEEEKYHRQLNDSLTLTDLQEDVPVHYDVLPLQRRGFFTETSKAKHVKTEEDEARRQQATRAFTAEVDAWTAQHVRDAFPPPSASLAVLQELSLASRAMNRAAALTQQINARQNTLNLDEEVDPSSSSASASSSSSLPPASSTTSPAVVVFSTVDGNDVAIPAEFTAQLRKHFLTLQELLRHFYGCYPVTAKTQGKLQRVKLALDAAYKGLILLRKDLNRQGQSALTPMITPLEESIEKCNTLFTKYGEQQSLKAKHIQRQSAHSPINAPLKRDTGP